MNTRPNNNESCSSKRKKYNKDWLLSIALFLLRCFAALPKFMKQALRSLVSYTLIYLPHPMKKIAKRNIEVCFPELTTSKRKLLLKNNMWLLGATLIEWLNLAWPSRWNLTPKIDKITGLEHLQAAVEKKQGVLLLFPHLMGVYTVGGLLIKKLQLSFGLMYHQPKNPVLKKFFEDIIHPYCQTTFTRSQIRPMIQHLKQGKIIWYAPDLAPRKKNALFVPFFNKLAPTYTATARIAQLSDAQVIPIAFYRQGKKAIYDIIFHPPLSHFPCEDEFKDAKYINQIMEDIIRKEPEQYLWSYKRFARQVDGSKFY